MLDWIGDRPWLVLLVAIGLPLALRLAFDLPPIPAWDNCTIGWAIPC